MDQQSGGGSMNRLIDIVKNERLLGSHDFQHSLRVLKTALKIAQNYPQANIDVIKAACILHDIGRVKPGDHSENSSEMAREILDEIGYDEKLTDHVSECIRTHSFRKGIIQDTIEAKILFDADKLDALGAVGIARTIQYAAENGQPVAISKNDPNFNNFHTPFHEYECKLKRLPDIMLTQVGINLSRERLLIMESFFNELEKDVLL